MAYRDALSEARRQHRLAQFQFLVLAGLCILLALGWYDFGNPLWPISALSFGPPGVQG